MNAFKECGKYMMAGARAQATWEKEVSTTILSDRKRLFLLLMLIVPIFLVGIAFADDVSGSLPDMVGSKEAYSPAEYSLVVFGVAICVGLIAGLISGCIGAGGGFVIAPALMSVGVKGIMAVGTDLFHIFAKAIMGSTIHRKLGNVCVRMAIWFVVGSVIGTTVGGMVNRGLYESNPTLSDTFITIVYSVILGFLGTYALYDYLKNRKASTAQVKGGGHGSVETEEVSGLPKKIQAINIPPMIKFDEQVIPGGQRISWVFLVLIGAIVGLAAGIMGVGGGFITFPAFVYVLGVSAATTVGTDIFQIIFTASYGSITQYAIYGFIFYTLAIGMLLGSLVGVQVGAMVTKVVTGSTIRGFFAMAVLAGFINRVFALPDKLRKMEWIDVSKSTTHTVENVGIVIFFIVIGAFAVWVIGTFLRNINTLKGSGHKEATVALKEEEARA